MSNNHSTATRPVKLMRWAARIISIPWAYWAFFWTASLLVHLTKELISMTVYSIIMFILTLMFFTAAIIASVWGKEAFGGKLLIASGAVILTILIGFSFLTGAGPGALFNAIGLLGLATLVLPALVAGALFLICHRKTKTPQELPA